MQTEEARQSQPRCNRTRVPERTVSGVPLDSTNRVSPAGGRGVQSRRVHRPPIVPSEDRSMPRLSSLALVTALCFCPAVFADKPAAAPSPATPQQVHQSVERSLKYLQAESTSWLNLRKCAACHHVALPLWSMIEAERQGYSVDKKFVAETVDRTLGSREKMIGSRILPDPKGKPDTRPGSNMGIVFVAIAGQALPSLSEGQKQSLKLIAAEIPKKQEKNGSWKSVDDRIPIHESPAIDTAWSIMAMEAGTDASKPSPKRDAIAKAKAWLDGQ